MNVFVIPSWYPSEASPISGIFFKEQASFTAEINEELNIGVSLWGQSDPQLMINKNILASSMNLLKFLTQRQSTQVASLKENLVEIRTPTLSWSHKFFGGNISKILKTNQQNLKTFEQKFGKTDIIHAHVSYPGGYIAMVLSQRFGIPYVITEHMGPFPFPSFISPNGRLCAELSEPLQNAHKVVAVSPSLAEAIESYGFQKPVFIPNVIDESFFEIGPPVSSSPFKFFTLANLSPEKGIDDLLHSIQILIRRKSNVSFVIGGGGVYLDSYRRKAVALGIDSHISWLGVLSRSEARKQYQECNAFVLPSHGETFGVVYAEAIASGKPIIATRCGGPECIVENCNGILAEVSNPKDLADKMICVIDNYSLYEPQQIRNSFKKKFSRGVVIPKLIETYRTVILHNKSNNSI